MSSIETFGDHRGVGVLIRGLTSDELNAIIGVLDLNRNNSTVKTIYESLRQARVEYFWRPLVSKIKAAMVAATSDAERLDTIATLLQLDSEAT